MKSKILVFCLAFFAVSNLLAQRSVTIWPDSINGSKTNTPQVKTQWTQIDSGSIYRFVFKFPGSNNGRNFYSGYVSCQTWADSVAGSDNDSLKVDAKVLFYDQLSGLWVEVRASTSEDSINVANWLNWSDDHLQANPVVVKALNFMWGDGVLVEVQSTADLLIRNEIRVSEQK